MSLKVVRSNDYIEDLVGVWRYHTQWSEGSAERILNAIEAKVVLLGQFPDLGERCPIFGSDCRRTLADRYVIYYRRLDDHIRVLRVLHGARDVREPEDLRLS